MRAGIGDLDKGTASFIPKLTGKRKSVQVLQKAVGWLQGVGGVCGATSRQRSLLLATPICIRTPPLATES